MFENAVKMADYTAAQYFTVIKQSDLAIFGQKIGFLNFYLFLDFEWLN